MLYPLSYGGFATKPQVRAYAPGPRGRFNNSRTLSPLGNALRLTVCPYLADSLLARVAKT
jgi:hypothetical protein